MIMTDEDAHSIIDEQMWPEAFKAYLHARVNTLEEANKLTWGKITDATGCIRAIRSIAKIISIAEIIDETDEGVKFLESTTPGCIVDLELRGENKDQRDMIGTIVYRAFVAQNIRLKRVPGTDTIRFGITAADLDKIDFTELKSNLEMRRMGEAMKYSMRFASLHDSLAQIERISSHLPVASRPAYWQTIVDYAKQKVIACRRPGMDSGVPSFYDR